MRLKGKNVLIRIGGRTLSGKIVRENLPNDHGHRQNIEIRVGHPNGGLTVLAPAWSPNHAIMIPESRWAGCWREARKLNPRANMAVAYTGAGEETTLVDPKSLERLVKIIETTERATITSRPKTKKPDEGKPHLDGCQATFLLGKQVIRLGEINAHW